MTFKEAKQRLVDVVATDNGSVESAREIMWAARQLNHVAQLEVDDRISKKSEKQFGFEEAKKLLGL